MVYQKKKSKKKKEKDHSYITSVTYGGKELLEFGIKSSVKSDKRAPLFPKETCEER